jgi:hypothetical protein
VGLCAIERRAPEPSCVLRCRQQTAAVICRQQKRRYSGRPPLRCCRRAFDHLVGHTEQGRGHCEAQHSCRHLSPRRRLCRPHPQGREAGRAAGQRGCDKNDRWQDSSSVKRSSRAELDRKPNLLPNQLLKLRTRRRQTVNPRRRQSLHSLPLAVAHHHHGIDRRWARR